MSHMSDSELDRIVDNEKEWRKFLSRRMEKLEEKQDSLIVTVTSLKVKFGIIGSLFGFCGGIVAQLIVIFKK